MFVLLSNIFICPKYRMDFESVECNTNFLCVEKHVSYLNLYWLKGKKKVKEKKFLIILKYFLLTISVNGEKWEKLIALMSIIYIIYLRKNYCLNYR